MIFLPTSSKSPSSNRYFGRNVKCRHFKCRGFSLRIYCRHCQTYLLIFFRSIYSEQLKWTQEKKAPCSNHLKKSIFIKKQSKKGYSKINSLYFANSLLLTVQWSVRYSNNKIIKALYTIAPCRIYFFDSRATINIKNRHKTPTLFRITH